MQWRINRRNGKKIDVIINFAAETHVDRSIAEPRPFLMTNVLGTQVLLETARKHDFEKFVQISTDEVYGSIAEGSFKEEDPLKPSSPYAASKAAADMLVHSYFVTYGLPALITRSTNNFGPYQHPEKLIPKLITRALQDKPLPIYGTGQNVRDWIYVIDHCKALDLIMKNGKRGEIYNISAGNELSNVEVVKKILKIMNKPENIITFVEDRPGHDIRYSLDSSKIRSELGWKSEYDFEEALRETVNWYMTTQV